MKKENEELINAKIKELEAVIELLKDMKENPDIGERKLCEKHNINFNSYRRNVYDTSWKVNIDSSNPDEVFRDTLPTMSWYELLWMSVTGIDSDEREYAPLDVVETMQFLMSEYLDPIQINVITLRYRDGMSLEDVGKELGLNRERVRCHEAKSIAKLRRCGGWMRFGKEYMISKARIEKKIEEDIEITAKLDILERIGVTIPKIKSLVLNGIERSINPEYTPAPFDVKTYNGLDTPIEQFDWSIRTFNCLKRAGINTLRDLTRMTETDVNKIRNLGRRGVDEIKDTFADLHIKFKEEE
jgi:hypothetical protein